jgi:hypothetical protein
MQNHLYLSKCPPRLKKSKRLGCFYWWVEAARKSLNPLGSSWQCSNKCKASLQLYVFPSATVKKATFKHALTGVVEGFEADRVDFESGLKRYPCLEKALIRFLLYSRHCMGSRGWGVSVWRQSSYYYTSSLSWWKAD